MFTETDHTEIHGLLRAHPFGTLVTHSPNGLDANHLPFLFDAERGPLGTLVAHVARANALWRESRNGDPVLVVFRGAQGYISPNWYPSKQETHRHVPTWNYEAVHAHGRLRICDDPAFVRGAVARLTRFHEAAQPSPWRMSDAPPDYLDDALAQIVGIEVEVSRLECKRKLSQNREPRDFENIVRAVEDGGNQGLANAMKRARPG